MFSERGHVASLLAMTKLQAPVKSIAYDPSQGREHTNLSPHLNPSFLARIAAICASGLLLAAYTRGYYVFGFVALLPWLIQLRRSHSWRIALVDGALMSMAYTLAAFSWLGAAIGAYTDIGGVAGITLICLLAPLLQPQFWLYALCAALTKQRAVWLSVWLGSAVWIISEWLIPKALGDTLAYGLAPSLWLRQGADVAGGAGLTALLLLVNAALALAWIRRHQGWRSALAPLLLALLVPTVMASYGALRLHALAAYFAEPTPSLRVGMVQTSMVDYEQRRQRQGSYAVVREVLDRHFALSRAAIEHHGAEALLWSETVYPTPYGYPRSADGAAFDFELKSFIQNLGVPVLFGSYDVDDKGEYNAAVLFDPRRELIARYRKTRLFPFTERVPSALDYAWLRRLLPWVGNWQPGDGARVFPLSSSDGRELNVVPLICLDDVDPMLAVEGARLGAQAIVGLSNDSWFSQYPQGMELHLAVARFRSIETRLPQLRVTTNGYTAFIDPSGEVLARTAIGEQAVLAGVVPIRNPPASLVTRWGTWLGPAALASLLMLALWLARKRWQQHQTMPQVRAQTRYSTNISLLSKPMRFLNATLKATAALALLYLGLAMLWRDGWQVHSTRQIYVYLGCVVMPLILSWLLLRAGSSAAEIGARSAFFDHAAIKFGLFPLLMALPAFRLHQVISFGSTFGEYYTFGAIAYMQGLSIWWASWSLGLMLWAAVLRVSGEALLWLVAAWRPDLARRWRGGFEFMARVLFFLAVPIWFALRVWA
jgi:apolipoprotein N-acyltransferase